MIALTLAGTLIGTSVFVPAAAPDEQPSSVKAISIRVENRASAPVDFLHLYPHGSGSYGVDRLDDDILAPGASYDLELNDFLECTVDVHVQLHSGAAVVGSNINLCTDEYIAITDDRAY